MDNSQINTDNFELLLQKQSFKKPSILYNNSLNSSEQTYTPQDVIKSVYSQVKAIQKADYCKSGKSVCKDFIGVNKSQLLSVNKLPVYASNMQETSKENPHKFDTQCVLDTQIMSIIDGAEALDANTGMTQEFDTTFAHIDDKNFGENNIEDKNSLSSIDKVTGTNALVLKEGLNNTQTNENAKETCIIPKIEEEKQHNTKNSKVNDFISMNNMNSSSHDSEISKTATEDTLTFIQNITDFQEVKEESKQIYKEDRDKREIDIDTGQNLPSQRSPSPVLNLKCLKRKLKTPLPLVVSVEEFENFENYAFSLIEATDFETATYLINSQILGKELCLNDDIEILNDRNSPVLEYKSDELKISSEDLISIKKVNNILLHNVDESEKSSAVLSDELLFSSDEEDFAPREESLDHKEKDFVQNERDFANLEKDVAQKEELYQEKDPKRDDQLDHEKLKFLPLTQILETCSDEITSLDKTMYVGFQTASNKSIQISKDSFDKAQVIFDDDKDVEECSLKKLVEKCERFKSSAETPTKTTENSTDVKQCYYVDSNSALNNLGSIQSNITGNKSQSTKAKANSTMIVTQKNNNFEGFMTASRKKIDMSSLAFERCQKVFKDIDLNEKFETVVIKRSINEPGKKINKIQETAADDKINDELILQEFENIEMSLEEKESNDEGIKNAAFKGFKAANKKIIDMSVNSMCKKNDLFQNIDVEEDKNRYKKDYLVDKQVNTLLNINQPSTHDATFVGFKTANNKEIKISDEALARTKDVFKDIGKDKHKIKSIEDFTSQPSTSKMFVGFKTANNRDIKISQQALSKTKNIFKDIDNQELNLEILKNRQQPSSSKIKFEGFKTAINKDINISDKERSIHNIKDMDKQKINSEEFINCNQASTSRTMFAGFKTANYKDIKISDIAISKTKDIFKEVYKEDLNFKNLIDQKKTLASKAMFAGFKTANNKDIKISNTALCQSKKIFKDIDKKEKILEIISEHNKPLSKNKSENVSDKGEVKYIFEDVDKEHTKIESTTISTNTNLSTNNNLEDKTAKIRKMDTLDSASPNSKTTSDLIINEVDGEMFVQCDFEEPEPIFRGFDTASNKIDTISGKVVSNGSKLYCGIENIDSDINETKENSVTDNIQLGFIGFKTANNKAVNISAEALKKTNTKMFLNFSSSDFKDELYDDQNNDENAVFKGFQTASKKPVSISAASLARSKRIFEGIDADDNNHITENILKSTKSEFKGFQTANKTPVQVDKKALIASKKLFKDLEDKEKECSKSLFTGFKTAGNKHVNVTKEALAECKKIFESIEEIPITQKRPEKKTETEDNFFKGFQTANKQPVELSKDALQKTKNLFSEIDNLAKIEAGNVFIGFKTASNNKVSVSEQALAKSRQLLQDIDFENDIDILHKNNNMPSYNATTQNTEFKEIFGFKTGSNKHVKVFEDAIKKSKKFLDDSSLNKDLAIETKTAVSKHLEAEKDVNIESMLDTQVINNFDENLCTEDFRDTPRPNKRSGSPILVCSKAKKRKKFETPYKVNPETASYFHKSIEIKKSGQTLIFREDYKKSKKYSLKDLTDFEKGERNTIDPYILNFNLENMLEFEFHVYRNDFKEGKMVIEDIKQIFKEATDKKLIPDGWLDIHLKLILWKLMSYEIRFPNTLGKVCTVRNVIDQLKYRYDKELYNAERPVLRKILERDDVPAKTMVLCVAGIYIDGVSVIGATKLTNIELLLTDGWYLIKATIDNMLSKLVYDGKIVVGSKIVTCGAELVNCEQGVSPWEDTSSIRLSISGNSTRPARWDEKLGLRPASILSRLRAVSAGGGKVSKLRVRVTRVYPRLYVEKLQDGSTVTRSERLEHQYQMQYEAERDTIIEKIYEEVEKEMSDQESQESEGLSDPGDKRKCYETGSQIAKLLKTSKDPMEFRAHLTSSQVRLLEGHVSRQRERRALSVLARAEARVRARNVLPLARGRVVDVEGRGGKLLLTKGMLSIWKPNDEVLDMFKEGAWIEVTNVVPTAFRNSEIQLSAGRQSVFRPVKYKEEDLKAYLTPLSRTCYSIVNLSHNPNMTTEYNEIDTVGIIFSIDPSNKEFESKNQFQNVYLADLDKNIICVNFWGGIKKFGYENVLDTGQVVYCGNLQKRAGNTRKNITQYRATEFSIFTKTPKNDKAREMVEEMNKKMFGLDRRKFCDDCDAVKQNSAIKRFSDDHKVTPYRFNNSDYDLTKNKIYIDTPVGVKVKNKAEDFNLTGLDFESTFKQQDSQELSPITLQRKKKVNEKIAKLKMYGEPPPLCAINIINKSKNASNSYKSPLLRSEDPTSNDIRSVASKNKLQGVATPKKLPNDCDKTDTVKVSSPILNNRSYVKRSCVNPVKLNFSKNVSFNKSIDNFAEEFDGSPPLSLE